MSVRVLLMIAAALLCACKGVGRSLVDTQTGRKGRSSSCAPPPSCAGLGLDTGATLSEQTPALTSVSRRVCPEGVSASCSGNPSPEVGDDCARVWNVDEQPAPDLSELRCAGLRITADAHGERSDVTVEEVHWSGVELAIESTRPITVHLRRPVLEDVHIALSGPVTLDVFDLGYLHRVQMSARADQQMPPTVTITDSTLESSSIMREGGAFPGHVEISRGAHVDDSWLSADALELDNLSMHNVVLQAQALDADDVRFQHATLSFDHAELTFSDLYSSRVRSCSTWLTLNGVNLHDSELAACEGDRLRAFGSTVDRASVAGTVDSEETTWTRSLFGPGGQLALTAYGSRFEHVNFCAETGRAGFGGEDNAISCSECEGELPMCAAVDADVEVDDVLCPQLSTLERCEQALPPAERSVE
jgi:hypothetical protein